MTIAAASLLAGILLFVAVGAISRADLPISYTFQWRVVVASFIVVVSVQAIATVVGKRRPASRAVGAAAACALALWGSVDLGVGVVTEARSNPLEFESAALAAILPTIRSAAHDGERPRVVLVRPVGPIGYGGFVNGVVNELDRAGADVRVDAPFGRFFGTHARRRAHRRRHGLVRERAGLTHGRGDAHARRTRRLHRARHSHRARKPSWPGSKQRLRRRDWNGRDCPVSRICSTRRSSRTRCATCREWTLASLPAFPS